MFKKDTLTWSSFAGQSMSTLTEHLEKTFRQHEISYKKKTESLPLVQATFLGGGNKGITYYIHKPYPITFKVIPAFADPITRFVFSFTSSGKKMSDMRRVSVLHISYAKQSRHYTSQIMNELNRTFPQPLWNINHHPRFQTGIILAYRIKRKWNYWIK